mmetsp:Transcript_9153/g.22449  ORF Transcript_9153/g.22449 Transcript_9153/m.22449 type:complete len:322 (+) Transcript_9153:175-1140(+)|eukprot:CAMPEP_0179008026 /NCGR_PEP_ID=MMETSP0795-20121207/15480_1 /TAXON_ID=88552 /ORGANISM="Amoebophrya sp., Strain Ameob2" /LENGTH=321 /DNA_ID=CAMNT_0020703051 /DNA_START=126 /DNA_END=1091 /DNA_ORIENTATION=+
MIMVRFNSWIRRATVSFSSMVSSTFYFPATFCHQIPRAHDAARRPVVPPSNSRPRLDSAAGNKNNFRSLVLRRRTTKEAATSSRQLSRGQQLLETAQGQKAFSAAGHHQLTVTSARNNKASGRRREKSTTRTSRQSQSSSSTDEEQEEELNEGAETWVNSVGYIPSTSPADTVYRAVYDTLAFAKAICESGDDAPDCGGITTNASDLSEGGWFWFASATKLKNAGKAVIPNAAWQSYLLQKRICGDFLDLSVGENNGLLRGGGAGNGTQSAPGQMLWLKCQDTAIGTGVWNFYGEGVQDLPPPEAGPEEADACFSPDDEGT